MRIATYAKALLGALAAGLGSLATALTDGTITPAEWIAAAGAALAALGVVYRVRNRPTTPKPVPSVD
ncbi:hypothetical protein GCM10012275_38170 [Longimycelium tulufanense]|uniref:Uncharacterized protein n=1 Tax=Longimycelium tulufanense TaxID=907463 RepID=A0A8J3CG58_9PSEU|nr:hypothetical protein [Longimycelium tulufanense]GGM63969.1 hypothetical protein GCM10012275_38170 [Longimycelium tulufanense]